MDGLQIKFILECAYLGDQRFIQFSPNVLPYACFSTWNTTQQASIEIFSVNFMKKKKKKAVIRLYQLCEAKIKVYTGWNIYIGM